MTGNNPSDGELVNQTLAGDAEAFARLYDRHARMVRAVVGGVSSDWLSVADMTQECFLRAYQKMGSLRNRDRFGAWVVEIARKVGRERKRSVRRDRHIYYGDIPIETVRTIDSQSEVSSDDQIDRMMRELATLPVRERLAIHAYFLAHKDVMRAAEILDLSRSGFYGLLNRALTRLSAIVRRREPDAKVNQ